MKQIVPSIGQSDHPVPFPSSPAFVELCEPQRESDQPYVFIHGELLHDERGLIEFDQWMPPLQPSFEYGPVIEAIRDYIRRVNHQQSLPWSHARQDWLAYEDRRCRPLLQAFLKAFLAAEAHT